MNIEQARCILRHNRKYLAGLYEQKTYYKQCKKHCEETGNIGFEYLCHNNIRKLSKEIAKFVDIQRQLKADISYTLSIERANRLHIDE